MSERKKVKLWKTIKCAVFFSYFPWIKGRFVLARSSWWELLLRKWYRSVLITNTNNSVWTSPAFREVARRFLRGRFTRCAITPGVEYFSANHGIDTEDTLEPVLSVQLDIIKAKHPQPLKSDTVHPRSEVLGIYAAASLRDRNKLLRHKNA